MENAEINNIIKIVGLQYKKSYDDAESLRSLRYGKIMIMTDQVTCLMDISDFILILHHLQPFLQFGLGFCSGFIWALEIIENG